MFYYLSEYTDLFSPLRVFQYTTFRAVFAAITALLICIVAGGPGENLSVVSSGLRVPTTRFAARTSAELVAHGKKACPTMGGILIIWAVVDSMFMGAAHQSNSTDVPGHVDLARRRGFLDGLGERSREPDGMHAKTKFLFQIGLGLLSALPLLMDAHLRPMARKLVVPLYGKGMALVADMGWWTALLVVVVVIVGASNAVNPLDGLDGLATGCTGAVQPQLGRSCAACRAISVCQLLASTICAPGSGDWSMLHRCWCRGGLEGFLWFELPSRPSVHGRHGLSAVGGLIGLTCGDDQTGGGTDHRRWDFCDGGIFRDPAGREFQIAGAKRICDGACIIIFRNCAVESGNQSDDTILGVVRNFSPAYGPGDDKRAE